MIGFYLANQLAVDAYIAALEAKFEALRAVNWEGSSLQQKFLAIKKAREERQA